MEQKFVNIGDKTYKCKIAKSEEDKRQGLMHIDNLPPDEGMLFVWDSEDTRQMWMKNTLIPFMSTKYILEVNQNSGIKIGDDFEIDDSDDLDKYVMKVIGSDGGTQFLLQGGERIVSRKETRVLIRKAKKAELVKNDEAAFNRICRSLGKYMFKVLYGQDHRDAQYVQVPEKKDTKDS